MLPAAVVVVVPPAAVVVVEELPPAAAVVVVVVAVLPPAEPEVDPFSGGNVSCPEPVLALEAPPPVSPLIHIPAMTAINTAVKSCQVFQLRRCFILRSPGWGCSSSDPNGPLMLPVGDVTGWVPKIEGGTQSVSLRRSVSRGKGWPLSG